MKKRIVFKKGKFVVTREGKFVLKLADKLFSYLKPLSSKIKIVGSIRRNEKNPADIDIVLIPKNREEIEKAMRKKGKFIQGGEKKSRWRVEGVTVELYYADEENLGAMLLAYSSRFGAGIGLRVIAKRKGMKLNQYGLYKGGKRIAGKTEEEIYSALGRKWKAPENR